MNHKAGFVNIIGRPNVGKSTLMNALVGEQLSIITSKAQTTRHRILGILNGEDFQVVFSDTPGIIIKPSSGLHQAMMNFVSSSLEDADILLVMTDVFETEEEISIVSEKIKTLDVPKILVINKIDVDKKEQAVVIQQHWQDKKIFDEILLISALNNTNLEKLFNLILEKLPESPAYYPKDALTDRPEKYFVEEIVREKILLNYRQEIPYASEVVVEAFQEEEDIIRMRAEIYVERKSQKAIMIGNKGAAMKKVGTAARLDIEKFFGKKVYLELFVKVKEKWRDNPNQLKNFGYR